MRQGGQVSGLVSLMTILCSLSLCVFAILTLASANREKRLTELTAQRTAAYYAAECAVADRLAALNPAPGESVTLTEPVGDSLTLVVEAVSRDGHWTVLRWQTVYSGTWEPEEFMEVWDGGV